MNNIQKYIYNRLKLDISQQESLIKLREILENFCFYCIHYEDKSLFKKVLEEQTDNFYIDSLCSYLIA